MERGPLAFAPFASSPLAQYVRVVEPHHVGVTATTDQIRVLAPGNHHLASFFLFGALHLLVREAEAARPQGVGTAVW